MRPVGWKAAAPQLRRIISNVEVERKFNPGPKFAARFLANDWTELQKQHLNRQNGGSFTMCKRPGELIRDMYYETQDSQLSNLGLWVRERYTRDLSSGHKEDHGHEVANWGALTSSPNAGNEASQWNAKLRIAGHFNNSQFLEINGKENVSDEVLRITDGKTKLDDLQVVSDIQTRRLSWEITQLADGAKPPAKMTIVMDDVTEATPSDDMSDGVPFSHTIGEVELFQELVTEDKDSTEHEAHRKQVAAKRMKELKEFMLAYPDLFVTTPNPIGKLHAYYIWKSSRG